jgi:hypothetical protein
MKTIVLAIAFLIAIGRIFITPRLTHIPSAEGGYEALAHLFVGFLIMVPFYDRQQKIAHSVFSMIPTRATSRARLFACIGWALAFWELGWFLVQSHRAL